MKKPPTKPTIEVQGTAVTALHSQEGDFNSLTDMLKANDGEFAGIKPIEFDGVGTLISA